MSHLRVRSDDEWQQIRSRWLGPAPFTWPFAARYSAWALMGGGILLDIILGGLVGMVLGAAAGIASALWLLAFTLPACYLLLKLSGDEMNVRQLLALISQERNLPRKPPTVRRASILEIRR